MYLDNGMKVIPAMDVSLVLRYKSAKNWEWYPHIKHQFLNPFPFLSSIPPNQKLSPNCIKLGLASQTMRNSIHWFIIIVVSHVEIIFIVITILALYNCTNISTTDSQTSLGDDTVFSEKCQ